MFKQYILPSIITAVIGLIGAIIGARGILKTNKNSIEFQHKNLKETIENQNRNLERTIKNQISENQKSLSVQYITNKRVDWIYAVRDTMSKFISLSYFITEKYKVHDIKVEPSLYRELNKQIALLKLFFNFTGDIDIKILDLIDDIAQNLSSDEFVTFLFQKSIKNLTKESQIYLKLEWERVKLETNNEFSQEKLDKKKKELYEKYDKIYRENNKKFDMKDQDRKMSSLVESKVK